MPATEVWIRVDKWAELRGEKVPASVDPMEYVHFDGRASHLVSECVPGVCESADRDTE
jgi:hypothetical protein